jgi:hypothetical protein
MDLNVENQGADIEEFSLEASLDSFTWQVISNYDSSSTFVLDTFRDNLLSDKIYRLRMRARNAIGWGDYSANLLQAITNKPGMPEVPVRDDLLSSKTSIGFRWTLVRDNSDFQNEGGRVLGYRIYMAKDSGVYSLLYDGKNERNLSIFVAENLKTGGLYKFAVSAYNFNGEGPMSEPLITYSCVAPAAMQSPERVTSTISSFTLAW